MRKATANELAPESRGGGRSREPVPCGRTAAAAHTGEGFHQRHLSRPAAQHPRLSDESGTGKDNAEGQQGGQPCRHGGNSPPEAPPAASPRGEASSGGSCGQSCGWGRSETPKLEAGRLGHRDSRIRRTSTSRSTYFHSSVARSRANRRSNSAVSGFANSNQVRKSNGSASLRSRQ